MTPNDLIETRIGQTTQRMRWPVDGDTTAKLRAVCRVVVVVDSPVPWYRRLLQWLKGVR